MLREISKLDFDTEESFLRIHYKKLPRTPQAKIAREVRST
jgi:hypothetical protein